MTPTDEKSYDVLEALRALLSDVESMYEGAETPAEGGHPEEFFGPFSAWKLDPADLDARVSISWPNLAISLRNAKKALRNAHGES